MASVYNSIAKRKRHNVEDDTSDNDVPMEDVTPSEGETSDSDADSNAESGVQQQSIHNGKNASDVMPKTRILILTSRGVTHR
jgi:ribosome biogenesis protein BRX1